MLTLYKLKPAFQGMLRPTVRTLARSGATANQVTLTALGLSVAAGAALVAFPGQSGPLLAIPAVQFLRMALNAVDGMLAREHDQITDRGTLLNELCDVVSDAALYTPLALLTGIPAALVLTIVWLAAVSELAGVLGLAVGGVRQYQGPMGKSDRALAFGLLALLLGGGAAPGAWSTGGLTLVLLFLLKTIANRCQAALDAAEEVRA